jgi:hypothetical protein
MVSNVLSFVQKSFRWKYFFSLNYAASRDNVYHTTRRYSAIPQSDRTKQATTMMMRGRHVGSHPRLQMGDCCLHGKSVNRTNSLILLVKHHWPVEKDTFTMSGSKRKSGSSNSDFKRIKAKVGKRAKKINETDVSFRSAALHVAGQSIENSTQTSSTSLILSSRGKSLLDLSAQLNHPASAVRNSSLKGMHDIVKKQSAASLLPHLSILIPACVHSCVDEDGDVRRLGLDVMTALFSQQEERCIQPFGPLLSARMASALTSLDSPTRIDGVKMARIISSTYPIMISRFIPRLLPPFAGLLADPTTRHSIDEILQALISLLKVQTTGVSEDRKLDVQKQDLLYAPGGRSRNSVILVEGERHAVPLPVTSINDLSRLNRHSTIKSEIQRTTLSSSKSNFRTTLLSRLRDLLVELTNSDVETSGGQPTTGSTQNSDQDINLATTILTVRAIRLLHVQNAAVIDAHDTTDKDFRKLMRQIILLSMELFPIAPEATGKPEVLNAAEDANVSVATLVLEVVFNASFCDVSDNDCFSTNNDTTKEWIHCICSHVIQRIVTISNTANARSSPNLDITCKLLRYLSKDYVRSPFVDHILRTLQHEFFEEEDRDLARSVAARRVALVFMELIQNNNSSLTDITDSPISHAFTKFVAIVPFLLQAWEADFIYESQMMLSMLHDLVRREDTNSSHPLIASLRDNCDKVVVLNDTLYPSRSLFEMYPFNLKRTFLGLVVMLRTPTATTLKELSAICSRSVKADSYVKGSIVDLILQSVFSIRQSLPMQKYLTFLINSIGISSHLKQSAHTLPSVKQIADVTSTFEAKKGSIDNVLFSLDSILSQVASVLMRSGPPTRILEMLLPQLCTWQFPVGEKDVVGRKALMEYLVKMRVSFVFLAYFSSTIRQTEKNVSVFNVAPKALSLLTITESVCHFVRVVISTEQIMSFHSRLFSPILTLMRHDPEIVENVISRALEWISIADLRNAEQNNLLVILFDWLGSSTLDSILHGDTVDSVSQSVHLISQDESIQTNESARSLALQISARLAVIKSIAA